MGSQRILFRFSKEAEGRFLSHHDLMRLFERALRRAALPVRMTQGFNPHPRLNIVLALPLGLEAGDEAVEIGFEPPIAPAEALERLGRQLPGGISLRSAEALPEGSRLRVASVAYEAELPAGRELEPSGVERFLAREAIPIERESPSGRRSIDLLPVLEAMSLDGRTLRFRLRVAEGATPRASEVVEAVIGPPAAEDPQARLRRVAVNLLIEPPPAREK